MIYSFKYTVFLFCSFKKAIHLWEIFICFIHLGYFFSNCHVKYLVSFGMKLLFLTQWCRNLGAQLTLFQPWGQIMPTTLLIAHLDLKTSRHLCHFPRRFYIGELTRVLEMSELNSKQNGSLQNWRSVKGSEKVLEHFNIFVQVISRLIEF